jgi:Mg2+ and Co2+ transporter CorA
MGGCKDAMQPTGAERKGFMDRFRNKKSSTDKDSSKKKDKNQEAAAKAVRTFADRIIDANAELGTLIETKTKDLQDEPKREGYNREALARLTAMRFHLSELVDLIDQYRSS